MQPLKNIRVLDLSRLLPGPFASKVLHDLGAEVDKIEDPEMGDYMRAFPPQVDGMSVVFHALNQGKRSAIIDLKSTQGRSALLRLLPHYDVLLEGFRPGVMKRLGLGYDVLKRTHPGIIYCGISGYGASGPLKDRAGHDLNYLARSGLVDMTGPTNGKPALFGGQVADVGGALYAVIGILSALHERSQTGKGAKVDISMTEAAMSFGIFGLLGRLMGTELARGDDILMGGIAPYDTYETKDKKFVTIGALEPKFWMKFCAEVELESDLSALLPGAHQTELKKRVATVMRMRTRDEWARFNEKHNVCIEPVVAAEELVNDPLFQERRVFRPRKNGLPPIPNTPGTSRKPGRSAPSQGEHTVEILGTYSER